jgi:hypothetical protein
MLTSQLVDPAQAQIQDLRPQLRFFPFLTVGFIQLLCQEADVTEGRDAGDLFQIQPQRIGLLQRRQEASLLNQLGFPTQAEGCFAGYDAYRFPEVYDSITAQDLLDFIRENITEERMALSIIDPKEDETCAQ